jgi:hypothetical protein
MKPMIVAFLVGVCLISGLYYFEHFMASYANALAEQGAELALWQRLLFGLAAFWGRFGWWLSPFLLLGCLGVAALYLTFRKSAKSA